ncbi:MAG: carbamoyltransferase HypF [Candidatus Tectomicrobia bacterium]|uniref:Carbamoyltransferase n=1 Tax=Tectimicrobiota bacterium TaxID=2528274 RepID=A0A933LQZ6_UNCTE|nr:carbamoyltransferase HypF [Candidatus Tectomicrobia bacterium]
MKKREKISITGIVQGVGFRPFVYATAKRYGVKGYILNSSDGVTLDVEGPDLDGFLETVIKKAPPLARIEKISRGSLPALGYSSFRIEESEPREGQFTLLSPDVSVCDDCLNELFDPSDRRYLYPFINCTNCGPRYTIILDVPYDRAFTTMSGFVMCPDCNSEYHNPSSRRFHAQPNACWNCGPKVWLLEKGKSMESERLEGTKAISAAMGLLNSGAIVGIKGIGGFHLACDATREDAVKRLRGKKRRSNKPFAIMCPDLKTVRRFCEVSREEESLLLSRQRPIVVLKKLDNPPIAESAAPDNHYLGVMLPYSPLHYLLFSHFPFSALVMTSGNFSEEPIIIDNHEAQEKLFAMADYLLLHDRDIYMRADDTVMRVFEGKPYMIRRSRGFVPEPIDLGVNLPEILACGAELKNTFTITKGKYAIISQHLGDLENYEAMLFFEETLKNLKNTFRVNPSIVAYDLHPDYLSPKFALNNPTTCTGVQHHHAHIASCMAENGLREKVIGVAFDGTGYGTDGHIWGGEFLVANYSNFVRAAHFKYIPMPGGDAAIKEPWRMALSYSRESFNSLGLMNPEFCPPGLLERWGEEKVKAIMTMIKRKINSPLTSSCGRLFDAVSSLLGLSDSVSFEAEAAIRLEMAAERAPLESGAADRSGKRGPGVGYNYRYEDGIIDFSETIMSILSGLQTGEPKDIMAVRFHLTLVDVITTVCLAISREERIDRVALSGGVFQNIYLLKRTVSALREAGFTVYTHKMVPSNDAGVSLGQAFVAAASVNSREYGAGSEW